MKKIVLLLFSSIIIWSCNTSSEKNPAAQEATETHDEHHDEVSEVIELNNGAKWEVNEEMKPYVEKGEELVNTYIQKKETDYKSLAERIKEQNKQLINSCTMDGKSHEELHKWLHPHLELVKKLEQETDQSHAAQIVDQLKASYQTYHEYFQ